MAFGLGRSMPATIPRYGIIRGGRLDGWRFGFRRLVNVRGRLVPVCHVTPPHWPFGREIVCTRDLAQHFIAIPGERAERLSIVDYLS